MESGIGLIVPFVAYLTAEEVHSSGVIAVVVPGCISASGRQCGYATRLQDTAVWKAVDVVLESFVFLLIGLQLPGVVRALHDRSAIEVVGASAAVLATVILVRVVWGVSRGLPAPHDVRAHPRAGACAEPASGVRTRMVRDARRGLAGRGLRYSAHGQRAPPSRTRHDPVHHVRRRGRHPAAARADPAVAHHSPRSRQFRGTPQGRSHLAAAQDKAARAATEVLDQLVADTDGDRPPSGSARRRFCGRGANTAPTRHGERLGRSDAELGESPSAAFRALRLQMLETERGVFIAERDTGRIDDDVLRQVLRELDLEEATLNRE
ncbi:hypothetical protein GTA28_26880 [Rhodococcus hoagii]|nr:hypothetical protein [Prescottella equi]